MLLLIILETLKTGLWIIFWSSSSISVFENGPVIGISSIWFFESLILSIVAKLFISFKCPSLFIWKFVSEFTFESEKEIEVYSISFKLTVSVLSFFEYSLIIPFSSKFLFESFDVYKFSDKDGIFLKIKFSIFAYK